MIYDNREGGSDYTGRLFALLLALSTCEITAKSFLNDTGVMIISAIPHLFQQEQLFFCEINHVVFTVANFHC